MLQLFAKVTAADPTRDRVLDKNNYNQDSSDLNTLAARHGSTEFELFGLAFYDGHGYAAENDVLQDLFVDFLISGVAPDWLKAYVKRRIECSYLPPENIKKSALITTGARSAIVKWRPSIDLFSFTLVGSVSSEYRKINES